MSGLIAGNTYYMLVWRDGDQTSTSTLCLQEGDPCIPPTNLALANVTTTSVDLTWSTSGFSTGFVIEYDVTGFTLGTGTQVTTGTLGGPITLSPLTAETTYDIYIWEICNGVPTDTISGSFTTPCDIVIPDYCQSFDVYPPDVCWFEGNGGTGATGPVDLNASNWLQDDFGNVIGGSTAARLNIWSTTVNEWMFTPKASQDVNSTETAVLQSNVVGVAVEQSSSTTKGIAREQLSPGPTKPATNGPNHSLVPFTPPQSARK